MKRQRPGDQAPPKANQNPCIQDLVINDMQERKRLGIERYGTLLQANNGRDSLRDAYEEALDLCNYLRQAIYDRDSKLRAEDFLKRNLKKVCGSCFGGDHQCDHDGCTCEQCTEQ